VSLGASPLFQQAARGDGDEDRGETQEGVEEEMGEEGKYT